MYYKGNTVVYFPHLRGGSKSSTRNRYPLRRTMRANSRNFMAVYNTLIDDGYCFESVDYRSSDDHAYLHKIIDESNECRALFTWAICIDTKGREWIATFKRNQEAA